MEGAQGGMEGAQGGMEGARGSFPLYLTWHCTVFLYHHCCHYPSHLQQGFPLPSQKASQTLPDSPCRSLSPAQSSAPFTTPTGILPPPGGPQHLAQLRLKRLRTADLCPVLGRYSQMFNQSSRNKTQGARPGRNCS